MTRCLLLSIIVLASATLVSAEQGAICLYSDAAGIACDIVDNGGVVQVYIVHSYTDGASAARFRLDVSGTGWSHLGDLWNYSTVIGSSIGGVSIGYGTCESSPFVIGSVAFMGASTAPGSAIRIVPGPGTEYVQIVDCDGRTRIGAGSTAYVNSATPCLCQTNQTPALGVEPAGMDFGYIDDTRVLTVINIGGGTLDWSLTESIPWLELSTTSGVNDEEVTVLVDRTELAQGVYSGEIEVVSNGGSRTISVNMTVPPTDPILRVVPTELTFTGFVSDRSLLLFNDGTSGMAWSVTSDQAWMSVSPASGVDDTEVAVHVDRTGLADGTYYGSLLVSSNGGSETVAVTLIVLPPYPILEVSKTSLFYPPSKSQRTFEVSNGGSVTLNWSITADQPWLSVNPVSGVNNALVTATVDRSIVGYGNHYGNLFVTSDGGSATITVELQVGYPVLAWLPTAFNFDSAETDKTLTIWNSRGGDLDWTIYDSASWLIRSPSNGVNDGEVNVHIDRTGMANGTHYTVLKIYSNGGNANIPVTMAVAIPVLQVSPSSFSFTSSESEKYLQVTNAGDADLSWSITSDQPWLSVNPPSGLNDEQVAVIIDRTGLADGPHLGNLSVTSNGGDQIVPVDIWSGPKPILQVTPLFLDFTPSDTTATFSIANAGDGNVDWTLSANQPWIEVVPPLSGTNDATVTVYAHPGSVPSDGAHYGNVTVNSNAGSEIVVARYVPPEAAQYGIIGVFSDTYASSNYFVDDGVALVQVHFFHTHHDGATAVRFKLVAAPGWIFLGDSWNFPSVVGNSATGVSIDYGNCLTAPTYLGTAHFFANFPSPVNTKIRIVADPDCISGQIEVVGCSGEKLIAGGGEGIVNPEIYIPTRRMTWGQIKSMPSPTPPEKSDNR